jgi:hypothetical protein
MYSLSSFRSLGRNIITAASVPRAVFSSTATIDPMKAIVATKAPLKVEVEAGTCNGG